MGLLRPRERLLLNALKKESAIRYRGRRMHKRFRSWAQQRVRQYWLPQKVCLTVDPQLMDGQYIAACVQKAASLRKHDLRLWYSYSKRIMELADTLTPQQMAYIFYGYGKSYFKHEELYRTLLPYVVEQLPDFHSHALMTVAWALHRVRVNDKEALNRLGEETLAKRDIMRPQDFIKITNVLARMGAFGPSLATAISEEMLRVLDGCNALQFRAAIDDVTIINLYSDAVKQYILERFTKTATCCRPQHFQKAFQSAVAVRVLCPNVWQQLSKAVRNFYIRLSLKRIPQISRHPSPLHWDVSKALAKLGVFHRNTFHASPFPPTPRRSTGRVCSWGCYWIDIGEVAEKQNCWFVDGPTNFYSSTNDYTEAIKLQHRGVRASQLLHTYVQDNSQITAWISATPLSTSIQHWGKLALVSNSSVRPSPVVNNDEDKERQPVSVSRPRYPKEEAVHRTWRTYNSLLNYRSITVATLENGKAFFSAG